jgi:hypothetical protein
MAKERLTARAKAALAKALERKEKSRLKKLAIRNERLCKEQEYRDKKWTQVQQR